MRRGDRDHAAEALPRLCVVESVPVRVELDPWLSLRGLADYCSLSRRTLQDLVNDPMDPIPS